MISILLHLLELVYDQHMAFLDWRSRWTFKKCIFCYCWLFYEYPLGTVDWWYHSSLQHSLLILSSFFIDCKWEVLNTPTVTADFKISFQFCQVGFVLLISHILLSNPHKILMIYVWLFLFYKGGNFRS